MKNNAVMLLARLLLAQVFLVSGLEKLVTGYAATQRYMESMGIPGFLLPLVIALEIGGSLALIAGFLTRWAALALAVFSLVAAATFHSSFGDQTQTIMFMKDLAMAGGLLLLWAHGAGAYSLDGRRNRRPTLRL